MHGVGDGNCGYCAVLTGLVELAFIDPATRAHLLKALPQLLSAMLGWDFIGALPSAYLSNLQQGCNHLMVSTPSGRSIAV